MAVDQENTTLLCVGGEISRDVVVTGIMHWMEGWTTENHECMLWWKMVVGTKKKIFKIIIKKPDEKYDLAASASIKPWKFAEIDSDFLEIPDTDFIHFH